jgi:hypothetical protein
MRPKLATRRRPACGPPGARLGEDRRARSESYPFQFVVSRSCRNERRPERMKINHEETKNTKIEQEKTFVLFVSSWLIL